MKPSHSQNFSQQSRGPDKQDETWVETASIQKYPRSYTHLTQALATIFEQAYIPASLSQQEAATGIGVTANDRKLLHEHYSNRYTFNYYENKGWSPLIIELRAMSDDGAPLDYIDADEFSRQMIFDFFEDLEEATAGIKGIKSDILTHTITVEGPTGFLRLIQALCEAKPEFLTSERYREALSEHMTEDDKTQSVCSGEALVDMMRESGPDEDHISAAWLHAMPSRNHSALEIGMFLDAPEKYNQKPLFCLDDLIAIVEDEAGVRLNHSRAPRPFIN